MRYALIKTSTGEVIRHQEFDFAPEAINALKDLHWEVTQIPEPEIESLESVKIRKNQEINQSRLSANQTSFTYAGKDVACDQLSRGDIDAVNGIVAITNSLPPSWVGGWKAIDNSIIPIPDLATWIAFYGSMVYQGTLNFNKAQTLKAQLDAAYLANDRSAMELISW
jgi:hypothetical protein